MDKENETEDVAVDEIPFNKQLRKATRDIHATSDALVNAKLAFALSDGGVWAEGLIVFYEIFRFLEGAMIRLKGSPVSELYIDGMERTEAFEKDLEYYLGVDWNKNYIPRESVAKYLMHLQELERSEPIRLAAYVYHLYMGLFSGGQILRKKRMLTKKLDALSFFSSSPQTVKSGGDAVTDFGETPIFKLKKQLVEKINRIAETLDEKTKNALLEESRTVFAMNNSIIKTVRGANEVLLRRLIIIAIVLASLMLLYFILFSSKD